MKSGKYLSLLVLAAVLGACSGSEESGDAAGGNGNQESAGMTMNAGLASVDYMGPARAHLSEKTFTGLDGERIQASALEGKNVLVNFWATWCAPCIRELPSLIRASEALGDDFIVLLASDETLEKISGFIAEHEFDPQFFVRLEGGFSTHEIHAVPSTNLYNPQGVDIGNWLGEFEWDNQEVLGQLRELAASKQDVSE